jgi:hypothetical protein
MSKRSISQFSSNAPTAPRRGGTTLPSRSLACALLAVACTGSLHPESPSAAQGSAGAEPALLAPRFISFEAGPGRFAVAEGGRATAVWVSASDHPGVLRVAQDLASDVERVTGTRPAVHNAGPTELPNEPHVIVLGSLGKSPLIDSLVKSGSVAAGALQNRWEASLEQVVPEPWPGVKDALVLAGSDPRGAIYAAYELSRQAGVSPWHYWDDVPSPHQAGIYVLPGVHGQSGPAVKYRGFFINDEAPALATWALRTFGPAPNPKRPQGFNHALYAKVFEVLLRLKGNILWPAVWGRSLFDDDPENQRTAADYGVVVGTSHEAPMMRAQDEWNRYGQAEGPYGGNGAFSFVRNEAALRPYWADGIRRNGSYESLVTMGMRGNGDVGMEDAQGIELMNRIVGAQRAILQEVTGKAPTEIPQVWTLYKEVQRYWDEGMHAPDDVTIVWCDDNWGNLRGLPRQGAAPRSGGYGIYYHFDYVGGGRNYKWVDTAHLPSVWEQLHLAYETGVERLWMVNVGDLKNVEQPLQFFMDYAWAPKALPIERLPEWERAWAAQQFGSTPAAAIASIMAQYHQLQSRRKPELLNRVISLDAAHDLVTDPAHAVRYEDGSPFSLTNYDEAARVEAEWRTLLSRSSAVRAQLGAGLDDAYFQLVHYAIEATANVYGLRLAEFRNILYARQGRVSAREEATRAEQYLERDRVLSRYYNHELAQGKWEGFQTQPKLGYGGPYPESSWQQPQKNGQALEDFIWPPLVSVAPKRAAELGVAVSGSEAFYPAAAELELPELSLFQSAPDAVIEVFNRGQEPFEFSIAPEGADYLSVTPNRGTVTSQVTARVQVDLDRAPEGRSRIPLKVDGPRGQRARVNAVVFKPSLSGRELAGFVEAQGYVSIEAEHYDRQISSKSVQWQLLPNVGRTGSGLTPLPVTAPRQELNAESARLEYDVELFSAGPVTVWTYLSPRLPTQASDGLLYAVSLDDAPPQTVNTTSSQSSLPDGRGWERNTSNNVNLTASQHSVSAPGRHVLKFWMVDPSVIVQKFVLDTGGLKPSYLGPPESRRIPAQKRQSPQ